MGEPKTGFGLTSNLAADRRPASGAFTQRSVFNRRELFLSSTVLLSCCLSFACDDSRRLTNSTTGEFMGDTGQPTSKPSAGAPDRSSGVQPSNSSATEEPAADAGVVADNSSGSTTSTEPACPVGKDRGTVDVSAEISRDTTWSCSNVYVLPNEPTVVTSNATLTIEPGTEIRGQAASALVVTRGAKLRASGRADAPIVFTSNKQAGERQGGDWGGVVLLGAAKINTGENDEAHLQELAWASYSVFGGNDETSDCGTLGYVRIEFAGGHFAGDGGVDTLPSLGVGGCGSGTSIHHVQLHKSADDGAEFWGGSPSMDHILATSNADDGIEWKFGFTSNVQFVVIRQDVAGDQAIEGENNEEDSAAEPLSAPTFVNLTAIGASEKASLGLLLRHGTAGRFYKSIFTGFAGGAIDVGDVETVVHAEGELPLLTVESSLFFDNGGDGDTHFPLGDEEDDQGFDEAGYFASKPKGNVFGVDPVLPAAFDASPNFVPAGNVQVDEGDAGVEPRAPFIPTTYAGALEPGGVDWTVGWTDYPEN